MRVIGIDPSLVSTGFGVISCEDGRYVPVVYGAIRTSRSRPLPERLEEIRRELDTILSSFEVDEAAVENPFNARNVRTALILGQVRGAVLCALAGRKCALHEYSALEIKKAVTGYGQAQKPQVQIMVRALLNLDDDALSADAADALAAAVCHLNARQFRLKIEGG
ncbi:MAG: crossover junction endodeoxyribonuclease RuvC [Acidobacteriota bacterium]|nr:crossover junction endodeoxyribonuclease RuvC [Acidobacteriota bacterium]